jgi:hypothetical protein
MEWRMLDCRAIAGPIQKQIAISRRRLAVAFAFSKGASHGDRSALRVQKTALDRA